MLHLKFINDGYIEELQNFISDIYSGRSVDAKLVSSSTHARIYYFSIAIDGSEKYYFYKEYMRRNFRDQLLSIFRQSRAKRAALGGILLEKNRLCAPKSVCIGEDRKFGFLTRNFLVTQKLNQALDMLFYIKSNYKDKPAHESITAKRQFISQLGETIGYMHSQGIVHGDLRTGNIFVSEQSNICFLDNERTRYYRYIPKRERLRNLVQINIIIISEITNTDRMRFFISYMNKNPELKKDKKLWLKKIARKTRKRLEKKGLL